MLCTIPNPSAAARGASSPSCAPQCCGFGNVQFEVFISFLTQFVGLAELPVAKETRDSHLPPPTCTNDKKWIYFEGSVAVHKASLHLHFALEFFLNLLLFLLSLPFS